jgi:hypothetical protein
VREGNKERTSLEVEPHQAQVVASTFKEALEVKGLKQIVKRLNADGISSPRGKGWIKTAVYRILTNEAYTGTLVWGKRSFRNLAPVRLENAWPTIVNRDTFDQVQALIKELAPARIHPRRAGSRYLLSGLAKCGHCGKALVGQDAKWGKYSYYVCGTLLKKGSGSC